MPGFNYLKYGKDDLVDGRGKPKPVSLMDVPALVLQSEIDRRLDDDPKEKEMRKSAVFLCRNWHNSAKGPFDEAACVKNVVGPYQQMLESDNTLAIVCIINAANSAFREIPDSDGMFPTVKTLHKHCGKEIEAGRIIVYLAPYWGEGHLGSTGPLGQAAQYALYEIGLRDQVRFIIPWSTTLRATPAMFDRALRAMVEGGYKSFDFRRQNADVNPLWGVTGQHTLRIYRREVVERYAFHPICDGILGKISVTVPKVSYDPRLQWWHDANAGRVVETPLGGMDEIPISAMMMKEDPDSRFAMGFEGDEVSWNISTDPENPASETEAIKMPRQSGAGETWSQMFWGGSLEEYLQAFEAHCTYL